jgi:hypothetical protein
VARSAPFTLFSEGTLVAPRANLRYYQAVPNMLAGIGLLFTFIGLVPRQGDSESLLRLYDSRTLHPLGLQIHHDPQPVRVLADAYTLDRFASFLEAW